MTKSELFNLKIEKCDGFFYEAVLREWDSICKPIDGFGDFEKVIARIGSIQKSVIPSYKKRCCLVFCADNGIVEEGISQSTKEVTKSVAENLGNGTSSVCTLSTPANTKIIPVDIGIDHKDKITGVIDKKVALGTKNFIKESALTECETLQAITVGYELVKKVKEEGFEIIATGEMGIGNTTTSTTLLCFLLGLNPDEITGRGAGLDDERLLRKKAVVAEGVKKLKQFEGLSNQEKAFLALKEIGGLDIAGLVGVYLGAAIMELPVVIDGVISATAAVIAKMINENAVFYMLASHEGREGALLKALEWLGLKPLIKGDMALGEGTGAVMLFPLLDTVGYFYENAKRFEESTVEAYTRF